jgi:Protein of unknown function (DUF559)
MSLPFTGGRLSDACAQGVTRQQLRSGRYERIAHDLYVTTGTADGLADRCRALTHVLPAESVFCLGTAARLLGLPLPVGFDERRHAAVPAGAVVPRRPQLVTHALQLPAEHLAVVDGLTVTSAARTFLDLAPSLNDPALVALGDAALHTGAATVDDLAAVLAGASRRRGVVRARRVADRLDGRAESAPESLARVWLQDADLPEAIPQAVVLDPHGGFVARVDLLVEAYRVVVEYEGAHHRDVEQYGRDLARRNRLQALGYLVVHLDATTLRRDTVVALVTVALRQHGWVPTPR